MTAGHIPVLRAEMLAALAPRDGGVYLDATFGGGGYSAAILEAARCTVFAIDRDPDAIARGAALAARYAPRLRLIEGRFGDLVELLAAEGVAALDGVVFDLGVSSFQLDEPGRGFSFRADGPLDMRMERSGPTAADLVNTLDVRALADVLHEFGEERAARRGRAGTPPRPAPVRSRRSRRSRGCAAPGRCGSRGRCRTDPAAARRG